jgi:acyl-coenzyme A synthetase/AMP-(fatty) acid ligase
MVMEPPLRELKHLIGLGVKKGDVVAIYMPLVPELAVGVTPATFVR